MTLQFPSSPTVGQVFPSPLVPGAPSWTWNGNRWVSGGFSGAVVSTSPMPPLNPRVGDLWFDPQQGQTYVWFDDGTSQQWVVTINQSNRPLMGVTDGSNAAPGEVGEYHSASVQTSIASATQTQLTGASITLTAGDWMLEGSINYAATNAAYAWLYDLVANAVVAGAAQIIAPVAGSTLTLRTGLTRVSFATPTRAFCPAAQSTGATQVNGFIQAWRMR